MLKKSKQAGPNIWGTIFWAVVITAAIFLTLYRLANADNTDWKIDGKSGAIVFYHSAACDSAEIFFGYPDTTNYYDSLMLGPIDSDVDAEDSLYCIGTLADLDSIGSHFVKLRYWEQGASSASGHVFGTYLNAGAALAGVGEGSQTYPCTLFVGDSSDSSAVSGVSVTVRPLGGGEPLARRLTDVNGLAIYTAEAESISVFLYAQGYDFNAEDTVVIAGAETDSLYGAAFSPSAPAGMTGIFCWMITPTGDTIDPSYVYVRPVDASDSNIYAQDDRLTVGTGSNKMTIGKEYYIISSDTSLISFNLFPNSSIYVNGTLDTSSTYEFLGLYNQTWTRVIVAVPDTTEFNPFAQ